MHTIGIQNGQRVRLRTIAVGPGAVVDLNDGEISQVDGQGSSSAFGPSTLNGAWLLKTNQAVQVDTQNGVQASRCQFGSSTFRPTAAGMSLGSFVVPFDAAWAKVLRTAINVIADSANVTPDLNAGDDQIVSKATAAAWTLANPVNPPAGQSQTWTMTIKNTSGVAIAVPTLGAAFKSPALTMPATGFNRSYTFRYDGTNHVLVGQSNVDVPN